MGILVVSHHHQNVMLSMFLLFTVLIGPDGLDGKESVYNVQSLGLIPGLGRSPREGHGNPPPYS